MIWQLFRIFAIFLAFLILSLCDCLFYGIYLKIILILIFYVKASIVDLQSLEYETEKTVLFWDVLWHKNFVCKNCETNLDSECAPKPSWPTGFEKSKIHQPNPEKLQFKGSKIWAFLLVFQHFPLESCQIAWILLPSNCNFSGLGWGILDFSKPVGQGGFGAHSEPKLVSQFLQTKFLCHETPQNSTVFSVSYSRDCSTTKFFQSHPFWHVNSSSHILLEGETEST